MEKIKAGYEAVKRYWGVASDFVSEHPHLALVSFLAALGANLLH